MAKKKKTYKVAVRLRVPIPFGQAVLTQEMFDWLKAKGMKEGEELKRHDPLFIQCIEELKPNDWGIHEIEEDKYFVMITCNDEIILTPSDIELINSKWIKI